jgi:hypothetical protein
VKFLIDNAISHLVAEKLTALGFDTTRRDRTNGVGLSPATSCNLRYLRYSNLRSLSSRHDAHGIIPDIPDQ